MGEESKPFERDCLRANLKWFSLIPLERYPERARGAALSALPRRARRHCDALIAASQWGWLVYPPVEFWLRFDGAKVLYRLSEMKTMAPLDELSYPGLDMTIGSSAPASFCNVSLTFLTALPEPGLVQIGTGLLLRTDPGWSTFSRRPSNLQTRSGIHQYEGIVETDRWFGPLFTNVQLPRSGQPIRFGFEVPLIQVTPVYRACYIPDQGQTSKSDVKFCKNWTTDEWRAFERSVILPARDLYRRGNPYTIMARESRRMNRASATAVHN